MGMTFHVYLQMNLDETNVSGIAVAAAGSSNSIATCRKR